MLRFRSDEQLVALFRAGHDEAFRAIHDRYQKRLLAYARQMLPRRQDAEDALQDVFVRAYAGLRSSEAEFALRAWLFRVAHNRCIDELRRPAPPQPEVLAQMRPLAPDPVAEVELRESLRRLLEDIRRLPDQQRSALLMRELGGMSYADLACSLEISVPAVKSVLVRARLALARAAEARDTACVDIRTELMSAHDRGVRPNATARRHIRDCSGCRCFRRELRGVTRQLAALTPAAGPLGVLANLLGFSGGAGGGATAGGAAAASGSGAAASAGGLALGSTHVATLIVAAVATAGGAAEIQHTLATPQHRHAHVRSAVVHRHPASASAALQQSIAAQAASQPGSAASIGIGAVAKPSPVKQAATGTTVGTATVKKKLRATGGAKPSASSTGTGGQSVSNTSSTAGSAGGICGQSTGSQTASTSTDDPSDNDTQGTTVASSNSGTSDCTSPVTDDSTGDGSTSTSDTTDGTDSSGTGATSSGGSDTGLTSSAGAGTVSGTGTSTTASTPSSSSASGSSV